MKITALTSKAGGVHWDKESILFSACNEDTHSELEAFGSLEGKRVFCVTAGGGRVLSLLLGRPRSIKAVDLNPAQNALLELKIAALRALDHDGYLRFLGVRDDKQRARTYATLRSELSAGARTFFDASPELVGQGVLFGGNLERYLKRVAAVLWLARPLGLQALLDARDMDAQRAFLARLETPLYKLLTQTAVRRPVLMALSGDPGFFRYLPEELPLHLHLYDRIHDYLREHLLRDNALLQLCFFGRYVWEPALPIYLHARTFDAVKAGLEQVEIEIETGMVDEVLGRAGASAFDAFSLSDISSYLDETAHARLFERVVGAAAPGARVCSRSVLHHRALPEAVAARLAREPELERKLARFDHACVHEFMVGTLR